MLKIPSCKSAVEARASFVEIDRRFQKDGSFCIENQSAICEHLTVKLHNDNFKSKKLKAKSETGSYPFKTLKIITSQIYLFGYTFGY